MRKILADYQALAEARGFNWSGVLPKNAMTKTSWQCKQGHSWDACYNHIRQGTGCPECSGNTPKQATDYHVLAQLRGFKWTSIALPENTQTKTSWQCKKGHSWDASYNTIQQGTGCPECCGKMPKKAVDYHALAQLRGFKWTGNALPKNAMTKTSWQCKKGHRWQARYNSIHHGSGCPDCYGNRRKKATDYRALAEARGFIWTGEASPKNIQTKTSWQCKKGHKWQANYNHIQQGSGCPECYYSIRGGA
jgi:hypothetical protein